MSSPSRRLHWLLGLILLTSFGVGGGCVRRRLTVRSNPPGARGYVDDYEIGTTPFSTAFTRYGTRRIRLEKDGMKPVTVERTIHAPWYQIPPLDFVSEVLWPFEIRDEREVVIEMEPQPQVQMAPLLERANAMRSNAQLGVTPAAVPLNQPVPATVPIEAPNPTPPGRAQPGLPGLPSLISPYQGPSNPVTPTYRVPNAGPAR